MSHNHSESQEIIITLKTRFRINFSHQKLHTRNIFNNFLEMLKCQHSNCEFQVTEEFHFALHNNLNHTVFRTIPMQNLINQILTELISSNDSTLEIKLTRSDFLKPSPNTSPKKIQKSSPEIKEENKTEPKRLEQKKSRLIHNSRLSSGNITQVRTDFFLGFQRSPFSYMDHIIWAISNESYSMSHIK